ncbi:hypothetical protein CYLTODRAFT_485035 [Cylindrobasidium torrendii FP15055 ss-10]|uniref:MYND-type domain-containing protein n=1 Tax=Cylindrobasidium torrendii FP15055 ss-10 TaxID=1314674 RepID=A0A0D7BU05_9AGAR|nr:hypothetical protein CYLTODRAFT_485035 [Cylindrobasidium torrendii FP15055 ss-10]
MSSSPYRIFIRMAGSYSKEEKDISEPKTIEKVPSQNYDMRKLEVEFSQPVPAQNSPRDAALWMTQRLRSCHVDIKHSGDWRCEFCNRLARESIFQLQFHFSSSPPTLVLFAHQICNSRTGSCADEMEKMDREMKAASGASEEKGTTRDTSGAAMPLSASCAGCKSEDLVAHNASMRCGRCHITRYCSAKCIAADWKRHGVFCKTVQPSKNKQVDSRLPSWTVMHL